MLPPINTSKQHPGFETLTENATLSGTLKAPAREPLKYNISDLARSIISASNVSVKLDSIRDQTESEFRWKRRYNLAYHSLNDRNSLRYKASDTAKARLDKQLESHIANQGIIASRLDAQLTQSSTPLTENLDSSPCIEDLRKENSEMRKELKAIEVALEEQKRKGLRQMDLDRYARKAVHYDDLTDFVKKQECICMEERISAQGSDLKAFESKLSDLVMVTGDRHREIKEMQRHYAAQFDTLDLGITDAQTKHSHFEESINTQKVDFQGHAEELKKLQDSLADLEKTIRGDLSKNEHGLVRSTESNTGQIASMTDLAGQLAIRMTKLEEDMQNLNKFSSSNPSELANLRHDLVILTEEQRAFTEDQKNGYDILADSLDELRTGIQQVQNRISLLKEDASKNSLQVAIPSTQPSRTLQADTSSNQGDADRVRLERAENDIRALYTQFVASRKQFENLTTEQLAYSVINQTKQLYKEHPGHVQDKLRSIENQQMVTSSYISHNLEPRLAQMHTAISAQIQNLECNNRKVYNYTVETRKEMSERIDSVMSPVHGQGNALADIQQSARLSSEAISKRLDSLKGNVEILNREAYCRAVPDPTKQDLLRQPLDYRERLITPEGIRVEKKAQDPKISGQENGHKSPAPVASLTSRQEGSASDGLGGATSLASDESNMPPVLAKRKRRSCGRISDSEEDEDIQGCPGTKRHAR